MKARTPAPRARLELDRLEDRTTPSASVVAGNLVIAGTTGNDTVVVTARRIDGVENLRVNDNGTVTNFVKSTVTGNIQFTGGDGNDRFVNLTNVASVLDGGAGHDWLVGGRGADTVTGGDGDDILSAGLDRLVNTLTGGLGADRLVGSQGNDVLTAGTGGTTEGDTSTNYVFGLGGNDVITGGAGIDYLAGNMGNDTIKGGAGNDRLYGGLGADTLDGGDGDDYVDGGFDNVADSLTGGAGADRFATKTIFWRFFRRGEDTRVDFTAGTDTEAKLF